jgi:hypothetical protein
MVIAVLDRYEAAAARAAELSFEALSTPGLLGVWNAWSASTGAVRYRVTS